MSSSSAIPVATVVEERVQTVQIPANARPGDSFIIHPPNDRPFTVIVPEGAVPGSFITVTLTDDASVSGQSNVLKIDKSVAGAAIIGGTVGLLLLGPVSAVVLAGGAAYMATKKNSEIGKSVRHAGGVTMNNVQKATKYIGKQLKK